MNTEEYLNYLQESQHIAEDSYKYIGEMYNYYVNYKQYEEHFKQLERDEKIEEILK